MSGGGVFIHIPYPLRRVQLNLGESRASLGNPFNKFRWSFWPGKHLIGGVGQGTKG